tara:strand:+ start:176 stop:550 length:375 start_codon:yes stop_codon:yes gene_type:complete
MLAITPTSGPNVQTSRGNDVKSSDPRLVARESLATTMPSDRQTSLGLSKLDQSSKTSGDYEKWKKSKVFHPRQGYSAVLTENFLKAKAGFEPVYMHSLSATKLALMSIMDKDKPRYSEQVNILA